MQQRKFEIKFKRYTDYDCVIEATTHAKAKMLVGYSLIDCGYFKKFGDVLREIATCRVLEPMKCGRKPREEQEKLLATFILQNTLIGNAILWAELTERF